MQAQFVRKRNKIKYKKKEKQEERENEAITEIVGQVEKSSNRMQQQQNKKKCFFHATMITEKTNEKSRKMKN